VALPHLELGPPVTFLGEPLAADLFDAGRDCALWARCDGTRLLADLPAVEQDRVARWHDAGLVVLAVASSSMTSTESTGPIVVSPHPDDAVLSVGALLAGHGGRILDVFTHETWTRREYYRRRPKLAAATLLREEAVACRVLGVPHELLEHWDAELRPAWQGAFFTDGAAATSPAHVEPELFSRLVTDIDTRLSDVTDPVLIPLAVGGHVDHVLARDAVIELTLRGRIAPERVHCYEDMPYSALGAPEEAVAGMVAGPLGMLEPRLHPAGEAAVTTKAEALRAYRLQVPSGLAARVMRYGRAAAASVGVSFVERTWCRPDALPLTPASPN
jgi:LmbE family N-acetylglucosaminyl deacetylase